MPGSTFREHDGASTRAPLTSTMQTRQAFFGVSVSPQQSVGIPIPACLQASRIVEPSGTASVSPSRVSSTVRGGGPIRTAVPFIARPHQR